MSKKQHSRVVVECYKDKHYAVLILEYYNKHGQHTMYINSHNEYYTKEWAEVEAREWAKEKHVSLEL